MSTSRPPKERFWEKVNKHTLSGCWEWMGSLNEYGYGRFYTGGAERVYAHRFSFELKHGPVLPCFVICHHCDNPKCVNPKHLYFGTTQENSEDMVRKGRATKGRVWVGPEIEAQIVEMRKAGATFRVIAKLLKVANKTAQKKAKVLAQC